MATRFELTAPLTQDRLVLEASAGTGKTYTLTNLAVRHLLERDDVPAEKLLVVTYTRAAANELRDRTRGALVAALEVLDTETYPAEQPWMTVLLDADAAELARRQRRAREALARFDDATITTIHGFCQQALAHVGIRSGADPEATLIESTDDLIAEVVRDVLIDELAVDPYALSPRKARSGEPDSTPKQVETQVVNAVRAVLANPGARVAPEPGCGDLADSWLRVVTTARDEVRVRQDARREVGYDRLVTGLHEALTDERNGDDVARHLADRFRVVLVDEFQDTDRIQWEIFERAFPGSTVVTVGDPKQAIYRFRGADVHAYLKAVATHEPLSLPVNHRSDRHVLEGLERIWHGAALGDERIVFTPVEAAPAAVDNALGAGPAVHIRGVAPHPDLMTMDGKTLAMPLVRQVVLADLVSRVIDLLDHGVITGRNGTPERVVPGDICVLVPTHAEASNVAEALRRARVPAVRTRTGSVLTSPAVLQWRLLLAALARPNSAPTVRAAALGWFFDADPASLVGAGGDAAVARLQEQCAQHADRMRKNGVAAAYDVLKSTQGLVHGVVGRDGGDRDLADLDHIAELLAGRTHRSNSEPAQVLRLLEETIVSADERSEATMRRVETDVPAVQITTVHGAKGLEYPIVLVPFAFKCRSDIDKPYSYVAGDERTLDVASLVAWTDGATKTGGRRKLAEDGNDGDALRLLYVALTRARHRVELWWACATRWPSSPLARLLLDREDGAGPVLNTPGPKAPFQTLSLDEIGERVRDLVAASGGRLALTELPEKIPARTWVPGSTQDPVPLAVASRHGRERIGDEAWRRWSFTGLSRRMSERDDLAHAVAHVVEGPVVGGADEATTTAVADTPDVDAAIAFADLAGSARFGTFAHTVLELTDFTAAELDRELAEHVSRIARRDGLRLDEPEVVRGLADAVLTPMGPMFAGRALRDLPRSDRLDELSFDLPLGHAHGPSRFAAGEIAAVLLDALDADDPVRPCLTAMAADLESVDIAGWMYGSIDAVLRIGGFDQGDRFFVVDYKTNRLHQPGQPHWLADYQQDALAGAMAAHHYPLQAVLYLVALHRYLRWRLAGRYDPDVHLGGVGYLFLRGMVGGHAPGSGVFAWRPATAAVLALDRLLAIGRAA
jgi:exodeoxyribonuclease V beta subunit